MASGVSGACYVCIPNTVSVHVQLPRVVSVYIYTQLRDTARLRRELGCSY